ncbi:MAG: hypothetical protein U0452_12095 [Anaerolineae bacterium]
MPFTCEWRVPGRVLYAKVDSELSIKDIEAFALIPAKMIESDGVPPVYFIADLRPLRRAPLRLSQLRSVIPDDQSENVGCYIIIVGNPIFGFIAAALVKLLRRPVRIVGNDDEAVTALAEFDPSLGPAFLN